MTRFDVCMAAGAGVAGRRRLVLVLQHEQVSDLDTVVVAPLYKPDQLPPIQQLRPLARLEDGDFVVAIDRLAALPKKQLASPIANLQHLSYEITKALDLLFSGF